MRLLLAGLGLLLLNALAALVYGDVKVFRELAAWIGGGCWLLCAVLSGALVSGDRYRANYTREDPEDRERRFSWAGRLFVVGLPSVAASVLLFFAWD